MFEKLHINVPMYDPEAVQPMRDELIAVGFEEMQTPEEVDQVLSKSEGTVLVFVNSVCGCAAGSARPGISAALQSPVIPDRLTTVFAGQDRAAVDVVRQKYLGQFPPSSPSIALFQGGKVVHMMHRQDIEGRSPDQIAQKWKPVFEQYCKREGPSVSREVYEQVAHAVACGSTIPRFGQ